MLASPMYVASSTILSICMARTEAPASCHCTGARLSSNNGCKHHVKQWMQAPRCQLRVATRYTILSIDKVDETRQVRRQVRRLHAGLAPHARPPCTPVHAKHRHHAPPPPEAHRHAHRRRPPHTLRAHSLPDHTASQATQSDAELTRMPTAAGLATSTSTLATSPHTHCTGPVATSLILAAACVGARGAARSGMGRVGRSHKSSHFKLGATVLLARGVGGTRSSVHCVEYLPCRPQQLHGGGRTEGQPRRRHCSGSPPPHGCSPTDACPANGGGSRPAVQRLPARV